MFLRIRLKSLDANMWQDRSFSNCGLDAGRNSPRIDCGPVKGFEALNARVVDVS